MVVLVEKAYAFEEREKELLAMVKTREAQIKVS